MALSLGPASRRPAAGASSSFSLEDELAEATQDLLDLGRGGPSQGRASVVTSGSEPAPSTLSLLPRSPQLALPQVDVSKALEINPDARLTPIYDDDSTTKRPKRPVAIVINDSNAACALGDDDEADQTDEHLPSSHLHRTMRSVSSSGLLSEPIVAIRQAHTSSPRLLAAQEHLRSQTWLNARGERVTDGKVQRRMDLLHDRRREDDRSQPTHTLVSPTSSTSTEVTFTHPSEDRTPAFFLESFPERSASQDGNDNVSPKGEALVTEEQPGPPSPGLTPAAAAISHAPMPLHLSHAHPSTAASISTEVTVKLHGNRRAERDAMHSAHDDRVYDALLGDDTLASLDPRPDSPIAEVAPHPAGEDSSSLFSLPATTATSSSHTSSTNGGGGARRRPGKMRRRRSVGSQSHRSAGEDDEDGDGAAPFARDVNIRNFSIVGERSRGYVAYDVRIVTRTGSTISILRRFSSFVNLRNALSAECGAASAAATANSSTSTRRGGAAAVLPPLPPRRTGLLHKYAAHHLEKRRRALQAWLATVMLDPTWGASQALRQWVVGSDDNDV